MALINTVGGRSGLVSTPPQQTAESMRRKERGTSLADAVVLERDKHGRGRKQRHDDSGDEDEAEHEREPAEHEPPNEKTVLAYTKDGHAAAEHTTHDSLDVKA